MNALEQVLKARKLQAHKAEIVEEDEGGESYRLQTTTFPRKTPNYRLQFSKVLCLQSGGGRGLGRNKGMKPTSIGRGGRSIVARYREK